MLSSSYSMIYGYLQLASFVVTVTYQPSPWFNLSHDNSLLCIDVRSPQQTIISHDHDRAIFHPEYIGKLQGYPDPHMVKKL
jgi:hypothetical protein